MGRCPPARPDPARERIVLLDGTPAWLRHVAAGDEPQLLAFLRGLSPSSRRLRFFSSASNLAQAARVAAAADGHDQLGVVACDAEGTIIGHAACFRLNQRDAEVAVEVDETHRHLGLATALVAALARESEQHGVARLVAEVLPENRDMLAVFHDGFAARDTLRPGEVDIAFDTAAWRELPVRLADAALRRSSAAPPQFGRPPDAPPPRER